MLQGWLQQWGWGVCTELLKYMVHKLNKGIVCIYYCQVTRLNNASSWTCCDLLYIHFLGKIIKNIYVEKKWNKIYIMIKMQIYNIWTWIQTSYLINDMSLNTVTFKNPNRCNNPDHTCACFHLFVTESNMCTLFLFQRPQLSANTEWLVLFSCK